jgi:hypothetical protein
LYVCRIVRGELSMKELRYYDSGAARPGKAIPWQLKIKFDNSFSGGRGISQAVLCLLHSVNLSP